MQPSLTSTQAAISESHNYQQTATKVQKLMSKWEGEKHLKSKYFRVIMETLRILTQKSETRILKCLKGDAERFQGIASYYDLKKVPKRLLLDLILRTSVKESDYGPGSISDKCVKGQVIFRCHGCEVITVRSVMHGDGAGYPSWHILVLDFTLPDGKPLRLYARHTPLQSENLDPVTELLQQGISQRMKGDKRIPKIDNLFTAAFFLYALTFGEATKWFVGDSEENELFPSDSQDESSAEELSEESET